MEYFEQKPLSIPPPPDFGAGMWVIYLSSKRRSTDKTSYKTSTVLTPPSSLQWRTTRRIGPSPSWTPLLNKRLMVICPLLYTGNLLTQTSTYSGTATTHLSVKFSVINALTHRAKTVCSNPELLCKERAHLRKTLTQCKYPNWALDKVEKRLNRPSSEVIDGANNQGITGALPATNDVKTKGHIVIPLHKVSAKALTRYVGDMAYRPTSKVVAPSRTCWYPPRTKTLWSAKVGPYIGSSVVTLPVMMNT